MLDPRRTPRQLAAKRLDKQLGGSRGRTPTSPTGGTTWWLAVASGVLILLIVLGRSRREPASAEPAGAGPAAESTAVMPPSTRAQAPAPTLSPGPPAPVVSETPALDLLVRLEARRRIQRAGRSVYLDSLLAESDSVLRRWPERPGQPVTVALVRDSLYEATAGADALAKDALARWQALSLGVEFAFIEDTTAAEVLIGWRDQFAPEEKRTGQTDLEAAGDGTITHARVSLARNAPDGRPLDRQAMLVTAVHELGHVVGLAHSDVPGDIMYPSPRTPSLSDRDRQTALLIYGLPPGSVKGQ